MQSPVAFPNPLQPTAPAALSSAGGGPARRRAGQPDLCASSAPLQHEDDRPRARNQNLNPNPEPKPEPSPNPDSDPDSDPPDSDPDSDPDPGPDLGPDLRPPIPTLTPTPTLAPTLALTLARAAPSSRSVTTRCAACSAPLCTQPSAPTSGRKAPPVGCRSSLPWPPGRDPLGSVLLNTLGRRAQARPEPSGARPRGDRPTEPRSDRRFCAFLPKVPTCTCPTGW